MRSPENLAMLLAAVLVVAGTPAVAQKMATDQQRAELVAQPRTGPGVKYGKPISEADLALWDIDIRTSDGMGLPPGKGSVSEGAKVYAEQCLVCHGEGAKGGNAPGVVYGSMVGGIGSFTTNTRVLTPGSMYPYAPILFDYVRRTMPMSAPQTLTNDQVYALAAYLLNLNGLVPADAVMDAKSLVAVQMPNRNGFILDDRPDTKAQRCMSNCPTIKAVPPPGTAPAPTPAKADAKDTKKAEPAKK